MIALGLSRFYAIRLFKDNQNRESEGIESRPTFLSIFRNSLPFVLTSGFLVLLYRIDKFVLLWANSAEAVAIFNIGWLCYFSGNSVTQAIRSITLPDFGSVRGKPSLLKEKIDEAFQVSKWFLLPGLIIGTLCGTLALPALFPSTYFSNDLGIGGTPSSVFIVLLAAWGVGLISAPFFGAVQSSINPWNYTISGASSVTINLFLSLIFIPKFGVIGASISTVGASIFTLAIMLLLIRKEVNLSSLWKRLLPLLLFIFSYVFAANYCLWGSGSGIHRYSFLILLPFLAYFSRWNPKKIFIMIN